ncbi:MAG: hypothetical protein NC238_13455 [Dehalobacter sp.]|nr:hypothetical protein [Dehalobacter sp.]
MEIRFTYVKRAGYADSALPGAAVLRIHAPLTLELWHTDPAMKVFKELTYEMDLLAKIDPRVHAGYKKQVNDFYSE